MKVMTLQVILLLRIVQSCTFLTGKSVFTAWKLICDLSMDLIQEFESRSLDLNTKVKNVVTKQLV